MGKSNMWCINSCKHSFFQRPQRWREDVVSKEGGSVGLGTDWQRVAANRAAWHRPKEGRSTPVSSLPL